MPAAEPTSWSDRLQQTLECYDEPLLRLVAGKLIRPRSQWPPEELRERCVATLDNVAAVDRRLKELDPGCRQLLALLGYVRRPRWRLGTLLELLAALGSAQGPEPIFALFEAGLAYPDIAGTGARLKSFEQWLGQAAGTGFHVLVPPLVLARALDQGVSLPAPPAPVDGGGAPREADGLEPLLRLAVVWQQLRAGPLRRTQSGDFFKRDLDRLRADPLLNAPAVDQLLDVPDSALLAVALARQEGIIEQREADLVAGSLPEAWEDGLGPALGSLWQALFSLEEWNPLDGWRPEAASGNPYPAAYLLLLALLAAMPEEAWACPDDLHVWVLEHHPYWHGESVRPSQQRSWVPNFLLGLAYDFRLVQAAKGADGAWVVRLSALGRWLMGVRKAPPPAPVYAQTLLVQPNLEVLAYRQGLTPSLVGRLTRFAAWKTLGSACTLQLEADTVYRGLESGMTFETILQTLEQHGMRPTPPAVVESLRTWADKRERITVYPSATLFEFGSPEELNEALSRGLTGIRVTDRLLAVTGEADFRQFRLAGTRDYALPPERCVEVEDDGVTLAVDLARSDLLLETELHRFAEPLDGATVNGCRRFRLTPASLAAGRSTGLDPALLEEWFQQRSGRPLSPAARLLLQGGAVPPLTAQPRMVIRVATAEVADGLLQWPETRELIEERLGPTALVVASDRLPVFQERLRTLGISLHAH